MKTENVSLLTLIFWFVQVMWMCFWNGIFSEMSEPMRASTVDSPEFTHIFIHTIIYFLPGLIFLVFVWIKYRAKENHES